MIVQVTRWSWENDDTDGMVCLVANSLYSDFLELTESGEIPAPLSAYRFPDNLNEYLDFLCLYMFYDDREELEFFNFDKSYFFEYIVKSSKFGFSNPSEKLLVPDFLQHTKKYLEIFIYSGRLSNKVIKTSVIGEHPSSKITSDWWTAAQMLSGEISKIRKLTNSLIDKSASDNSLINCVDSYLKIFEPKKLEDSAYRLIYMSAYLYVCAEKAHKEYDFSKSIVLIHRCLEYSLTSACLDIHAVYLGKNNDYFFNNTTHSDLVGVKTNLFGCIKALSSSQDIMVTKEQKSAVHGLNKCRNDSKLAHGFMVPDGETSNYYLNIARELSEELLDSSFIWKGLVKKFNLESRVNIKELISLESDFSDFIIQIK